MLSSIKIENFKSIGKEGIRLELKPLTLLVGPNGSGKSSIIQAIAFAAQNGNTKGEMFTVPVNELLHQAQKRGQATLDVTTTFENVGVSFRADYRDGVHSGNSRHTVGDLTLANKTFQEELLDKFFLISSVRGNVPLEATTGSNIKWVGVNGQWLLELLAIIFGQRQHDTVASQIAYWASRFGMVGLKAGFWGGSRLNADYRDNTLKTTLRLALASSGARQVLTVITQLFWSPPRSIIALEEPEISLHPKAQIDIAELFSLIIKQDKQIIATTHSSLLILALTAAVQKKLLQVDDIAIYHVEKKSRGGTQVKRLPLNKQGRLLKWIPSFAKEERRLFRALCVHVSKLPNDKIDFLMDTSSFIGGKRTLCNSILSVTLILFYLSLLVVMIGVIIYLVFAVHVSRTNC